MHKVNDTFNSVENALTVQEIIMKNLKIRVMAVFLLNISLEEFAVLWRMRLYQYL